MNKQIFKLQIQFRRVLKSPTSLKLIGTATCVPPVYKLQKEGVLCVDVYRRSSEKDSAERQFVQRHKVKCQDRELFQGEQLSFEMQFDVPGLLNRSDFIVELVASKASESKDSDQKLAGAVSRIRVRELDCADLDGLDMWQASGNCVLPFNALKNLARRNNLKFNSRQDDGLLSAVGEKNPFTQSVRLKSGKVLSEIWDFEFSAIEGETLRQYPESIIELDSVSEREIRKADWPQMYDNPSFSKPGAVVSIKLINLRNVSLVVGEKGFVLFRGNKVLRESAGIPIFDPSDFPQPAKVFSVGTWCGGRTKHNNIYHALLDDAARAWLISSNVNETGPLCFPSYSIPYCIEAQEALLKDRVEYLKTGVRYDFEQLHMLNLSANGFGSPAVGFDENYIEYVRAALNKDIQPELPSKIYISRQDAATRRIDNEEALRVMLEKLGYQTVVMTRFTPAQQRALFKNASCIVAEHGASLTNLVFCNPGTSVIELFSPIKASLAYAKLSVLLNLRYRAVVGDAIVRTGVKTGWKLDLESLESCLTAFEKEADSN